MIRTILVPLDGSAFGEHALAPALGIARRAGAMLRLAVVYEPAVPLPPVTPTPVLLDPTPAVPIPDPRLDDELRAQRKSYLASVAARLAGQPGVNVTTVLLEGAVSDALVTHAEEIGADLVVMTTHGRGGLSRLWLGSVAEDVIRAATRPVLLVRPGDAPSQSAAGPVAPRGFARLLVALDGSSLAETIFEPAMDVVGSEAEWVLVRVIEPITAISLASFGGVAGTAPEGLEQQLGNVGHYLESVGAGLRTSGLTVRTHTTVHTQPGRAILEYTREVAADIVAMATHGRSGFRRLVMGSVADKVLRGGETTTLLYRPPAE